MEMKTTGSRLVCLLMTIAMLFSFIPAVFAQAEDASATTAGFYVDGTKIRDANGNEFVMRGVNHAYAWYKDTIETAIKASAELGSNTVRIVIADGQKWTKTTAEEVERLILISMKYKVVPMLEVHDITGNNRTASLNKTVDYWIGLKDVMQKYEKYAILNIANEWMGEWGNGEAWSEAYQSAVVKLREAGINNMIVVDAPGWGQDGGSCGDYCREVFDADPNKNTIFSIHMYGSAGGTKSKIKNNIDGVLENGVPVIIGEFGYNHSDGDVDEEYIMEYCTELNVGYIGWSWKGNGGGVEYLDIADEWDGSQLSADWGENLFNNENGIKNTSVICSIYTDGTTPDVSIPDSSSEPDESDPDSSVDDSSVNDSDDSSIIDDESQTDSNSDSSSVSDADSKTESTDDSSKKDTNNTINAGSSTSGGTTSSGKSSGTASSATGSDKSVNTGASALAFVSIALAGVAVVTIKKKK